ncbi:hypothetical protein JI435_404990 [Parastagonospora nodorum SN15]|uniref:Uncharacterized protein n=1 Tax=Phaeosphaeria nodorum (strain SN15 / ATCC MYA-4574 / FGSC 10173) TaxID=321614 RepID=A0A7U2EWI0_PHANO|nr:hypothetical protein JI435_404990 [Parastagonospora nodorum SN15]
MHSGYSTSILAAHIKCWWLMWLHARLRVDGPASDSARMRRPGLAPTAAAAACQAADDDAEQRDDGVDDGLETGGNGVDNGHDAVADGAEHRFDLFHISTCESLAAAIVYVETYA